MKMPFTTEQFFDLFRSYNEAVFPLQIVFYSLGILFAALTFIRKPWINITISAGLSLLWFWMALVYHLLFFSTINKAAYAFGLAFIIQALLLAWYGLIRKKLNFGMHWNIYTIIGWILVGFALVVYPIIGYALGHRYPMAPTFGLPCPTTIFTFGMLLLLNRKCPVILLVIPFLWSVIGVGAAIAMGVYEDAGLLVLGLTAVTLILKHNRKLQIAL